MPSSQLLQRVLLQFSAVKGRVRDILQGGEADQLHSALLEEGMYIGQTIIDDCDDTEHLASALLQGIDGRHGVNAKTDLILEHNDLLTRASITLYLVLESMVLGLWVDIDEGHAELVRHQRPHSNSIRRHGRYNLRLRELLQDDAGNLEFKKIPLTRVTKNLLVVTINRALPTVRPSEGVVELNLKYA